jgi:hypothetical protein
MVFWFKRKKIVLDCFTSDIFTYENAKVDYASKFIPKWWKELPQVGSSSNDTNMKYCRGFTELYKNSFIIPFWGTLQIEVNDISNVSTDIKWFSNFKISHGTNNEPVEYHNRNQFKDFVSDKFTHLKINCPWYFTSKSKTNYMFSDPLWNRSDLTAYSVLPGVVDYKFNNTSNVNIMIELRTEKRIISFFPGDPIAMITPMTEDEIDLRTHLESSEFTNGHFSTSSRFSLAGFKGIKYKSAYNLRRSFTEEQEEMNKSKCPFGFKK